MELIFQVMQLLSIVKVNKMKRFLLFVYDKYYPNGGWNDFRGDFDTIMEAKDKLLTMIEVERWHIVDINTKKIIADWTE